ncbi:MAG: hypothetical protein H0T48_08425 [Gemmatimonadaceae bacterium]|nr:hypothetical protein [Gemmatimonadaceae bacterium]
MKLFLIAAMVIAAVGTADRAAGQGQDQYAFGLSGGAAIATADLHDHHDSGFNGTLSFGIGGVDSPVGIRFDGMYNRFGDREGVAGTLDQGEARIAGLTGNLVFNVYGTHSRVYGITGVGGYSYSPTGAGTKGTNDFGVNAGLGLWLPFVNGFVEARFHHFYRALPDAATGTKGKKSARFYPITFGILY